MVALAEQYGRYGYRRVTELLRRKGWQVNHKRVERLWRREGLKVPQKQPKRRRLWLNDGSCVRLRPAHRDHVWSYDFVHHRTHDGRAFRMLTLIDEFTRECLAIDVARRLTSERAFIYTLAIQNRRCRTHVLDKKMKPCVIIGEQRDGATGGSNYVRLMEILD